MNGSRPCGCKGCRSCLICERDYGIKEKNFASFKHMNNIYVYCPLCDEKAWPGWDMDLYKQHPNHKGTPINYSGIYIEMDFLTEHEEVLLMNDLDQIPWELSQSGRRKQNFGPKCNFKKRKLRIGDFNGFPISTKFVQDKFKHVPLLSGYQTIEQCSLEYDPLRGASIDPHIDDCWIWGERIVTVNLNSDSVLTMTRYIGNKEKYNLALVENYINKETINENTIHPIIRIPMPRRSLLIIYGSARYDWEHCVLREDIISRRVCLAYREFTLPYLENGPLANESNEINEKAKLFW